MTDLDDLRALAPRIPKARAAADAALPGYGTHSDGPGSGHGDRTVTLALKETMANDRAVHDLHRLSILAPNNSTDRLERFHHAGVSITRQVSELHDIVTRWAPTERMVEGLRATGNDSGDGWCRSHWRVGSCHPPKNPGGQLCRWCLDWVRAFNDPAGDWAMSVEMPPLPMVEAHTQGRRVDSLLPPRRKANR